MSRRTVSSKDCSRCQWYRSRRRCQFRCQTRWGTFDVNAAEKLVKGRRPVRLMSLRSLRYYAKRDNWLGDRGISRYHVPHVDNQKPVIFGTLSDSQDGVRIFLLEGHHRCLSHLFERIPQIQYFLLSVEETRAITLRRRNRRSTQRSPTGRRLTPKTKRMCSSNDRPRPRQGTQPERAAHGSSYFQGARRFERLSILRT